MKLESFWGEYTNPHYDPERANNGGGYWQYKGGALYTSDDGRSVVIETEDASQGDFGTTYGYDITVDGLVYRDDWGSNDCMGGKCEPDHAILSAAAGKIGITVDELVVLIGEADNAANLAASWLWDKHHQD